MTSDLSPGCRSVGRCRTTVGRMSDVVGRMSDCRMSDCRSLCRTLSDLCRKGMTGKGRAQCRTLSECRTSVGVSECRTAVGLLSDCCRDYCRATVGPPAPPTVRTTAPLSRLLGSHGILDRLNTYFLTISAHISFQVHFQASRNPPQPPPK